MELSELRVFLKVAAERSFSRAAMKLHRTQPAVSQAVKRLEESVGERLFDRATKDATLTDAAAPARFRRRLLALSEEAEIAVKDLRDLRRGRVLIAPTKRQFTSCCRSSPGSGTRTHSFMSMSGESRRARSGRRSPRGHSTSASSLSSPRSQSSAPSSSGTTSW